MINDTLIQTMVVGVKFSDLFVSSTLSGNVKWLSYINWVGEALQILITISSVLAASLLIFRISSSALVASNPDFFRGLHEKKKASGSNNVLEAMVGTAKSIKGKSVGVNTFTDFFLSLVPDFFEASDFNGDESKIFSFSSWILNKTPSYALAFMILGMMWNNSMIKGFFMISDGMGAIASTVVDYDLENTVNKLLDKNLGGYTFSLGTTGTGIDFVQGKTASKIFDKTVGFVNELDESSRRSIGSSIESTVASRVDKEVIAKYSNPKITDYSELSDKQWEDVSVNVLVSPTKSNSNALVLNASDLGLQKSGDTAEYVHVYFTYKPSKEKTNYWIVDSN